MKKVKNKLRVCHFPQVPCKPFIVEVKDEEQAFLISETLALQHCFLFENKMIPDYANIITIEMWTDGEDNGDKPGWIEYYNDEEGMEFDEIVENYFLN